MTSCPKCDGSGRVVGFACPGFIRRELPCPHCDGKGLISDVMLTRINRARTYRDLRVSADMSLRELARRAGMKPSALSAVEMGRSDPPEALLAIYEELKR